MGPIIAAALPLVFGVQLGEPVSLPECARVADRHPSAHGLPPPYVTTTSFPCQMVPLPGQSSGAILFPSDKAPELAGGYMMVTTIADGRLEGLYVSMMGYKLADAILAQLTEKFGAPTQSGTESVTIFTMSIAAPWALWSKPGYSVEYHAIGGRLDRGALAIETDRARAALAARRAAVNRGRTPL